MQKLRILAAFAVVLSHSAPSWAKSKPKSISHEEASAFELSLLARPAAAPTMPAIIYTQPRNKTEACRILTSQDQISRTNFRAYWDGECRNGFAYGLGRDIAISDTHHVEEITVHDGRGGAWSRPSVFYDFVNQKVAYSVAGARFPAQTTVTEDITNPISGFTMVQTVVVVDEAGKSSVMQMSPFSPTRIFLNSNFAGSIGYKFTDNSAVPMINPGSVAFAAEVFDPINKVTGIVALRSASGSVQQFRLFNGASSPVRLPASYVAHLQSKYQEVLSAASQAGERLQRAQQIEREYLYKACGGTSGIEGLDRATYTKICNWREAFKEPYAAAAAKYLQQLESVRAQATTVEQQRQVQHQMALQAQMLQQQRSQQAWNEINRGNEQLRQQSQQMMQTVNNWQAPSAGAIAPPGGHRVVCQYVGSVTICR